MLRFKLSFRLPGAGHVDPSALFDRLMDWSTDHFEADEDTVTVEPYPDDEDDMLLHFEVESDPDDEETIEEFESQLSYYAEDRFYGAEGFSAKKVSA